MVAPPVAPRGVASRASTSPPSLIDTHAHLNDRQFSGDVDAVLDRARAAGVVACIVVGYDVRSSEAGVALAQREPDVWAAVGVHPHHAKDVNDGVVAHLERLARQPRVVAIGECGLDFFRNLSPAESQRCAFEAQLDLATRLSLPIVVHSREAMAETLQLLERKGLPAGGVMHCFDGTAADARRTVALGMYVSCAGPLTYRKDQTLAQAIRVVREDRLVIETDCPYLSPDGFRGKRNEPAHVRLVAEAAARVREVGFAEMAFQTSQNARRLFDLPDMDLPETASDGADDATARLAEVRA
jgi:TatD DNase family protein